MAVIQHPLCAGNRPLPSCLGGGDLDGDVYNVTWLKDLHPSHNVAPAAYTAAPKKYLNRPSTKDDVADFVADYIINDVSSPSACFFFKPTFVDFGHGSDQLVVDS